MANQISNLIKTTRVMNAVAAGTTDQNSASLDMANFEGVRLTALFGTITVNAVTSIKAQQSDDDGVADAFSDLAGSAIAVAADDDNQAAVLDIWRPQKRYVRLVIDRGTANAVIDGVLAEQYGARKLPTTDDAATVVAREVHASPDEGTA